MEKCIDGDVYRWRCVSMKMCIDGDVYRWRCVSMPIDCTLVAT